MSAPTRQDAPVGTAVELRTETLPAAQSETAAVLSMIERLAKDPSVDIDRVERMMALHREMRAEKAREAFNIAMAGVQAKLPQIKRDAANRETHSRYARLETIAAQVDPIIAEAGLSLSYGTEPSALPNHYKVVCTVSLGAHERRFELDTPADGGGIRGNTNKTAIQAMGSSLSYARRYLKLMIFDIALTNEDNDGNRIVEDRSGTPTRDEPAQTTDKPTYQRISADQAKQIRDAIKFVGETEANFCKATNTKAIEAIYADDFQAALKFIRSAGGSNAGRR